MAARKAGFEVAAAAVKSRAATHAAAECVSITCPRTLTLHKSSQTNIEELDEYSTCSSLRMPADTSH